MLIEKLKSVNAFDEVQTMNAYALGTKRFSILAHDLNDAKCPLMQESFGRYINHSAKHSNLKAPQLINLGTPSNPSWCALFQASRNIGQNEEFFYDYSDGLGEKSPETTDLYDFDNPSFYNDCYCKSSINRNLCFNFLKNSKYQAEYEAYRNTFNSNPAMTAGDGEPDLLTF